MAARTSAKVKGGYSATICSGVSPSARLSSTTDTMMRVPRTLALPWQMSGSTVMCSCQEFITFSPLRTSLTPGTAFDKRNLSGRQLVKLVNQLVNLTVEGGTLVFIEWVVLNRFNKLSSCLLIFFNRHLDGALRIRAGILILIQQESLKACLTKMIVGG